MREYDIIHAAEFSALAYKKIQPDLPNYKLTVINDSKSEVQCFIRKYKNRLNITFRGTDSLKDWLTNLAICKKSVPYNNVSSKIKVHSGFINAYKSPLVRDKIHSLVSDDIHIIKICGHSYGAALAVLCGVDLEYNYPKKDYEVILFGCPRIGNCAFQKSYNKRVIKTLRVENGNDFVTKLPFILLGYRHVGVKLQIGKPKIFLNYSFKDHKPQSYWANLIKKYLAITSR